MALWECSGCGTAYAVGLPRCPHCSQSSGVQQEDEVPKISVSNGPSDALAEPGQPGYVEPTPEAEAEAAVAAVADPEVPDLPAPPPASAPKADHVDFAVQVAGLPEDEAKSLTKAELVETVKAVVADPPAAVDAKGGLVLPSLGAQD